MSFEQIAEHKIFKTTHSLPDWTVTPIGNTYGNKAVLDFKGEPVYAELFALKEFKEQGWDGVWVDTFRKRFRVELPEKSKDGIEIPEWVKTKLDQINQDKLSGTWDLLLWKGSELRFVELKRSVSIV